MAFSLSEPFPVAMSRNLRNGGFFALWQVQSKLSSVVLLALVAFSPALTMAVLLAWTIVASFAYHLARERGVPDLMHSPAAECGTAMRAGQLLGRVWLVGLNAFAYANVLRPALTGPSAWRRSAVLATGLVLFGITTSRHLLQCSGFSGTRLLLFATAGACLNVPYRVFCGALTLHLVLELVNITLPSTSI